MSIQQKFHLAAGEALAAYEAKMNAMRREMWMLETMIWAIGKVHGSKAKAPKL